MKKRPLDVEGRLLNQSVEFKNQPSTLGAIHTSFLCQTQDTQRSIETQDITTTRNKPNDK